MHIQELSKQNHLELAYNLANMFRYQDDCIIFNDDGAFGRLWKEIYPTEKMVQMSKIFYLILGLELPKMLL